MAEMAPLARGEDPEAGLVRTFKAVDTCAAEFEAATPYYYSGWERPGPDGPRHEVRRGDNASVVILGLGPEPDRPGHRVRLLLRARRDDRARVGPRRGDGQLQPRDGLDRLRHLRPPLLRAAHARGRARGDRARAAGGRDRPVRRPDAAEARPGPGRRRRAAARHAGRVDPPGRGPAELRRAARRARPEEPAVRHGDVARRGAGRRRRRRATRCSCARATCSAAGRWRSVTPATALAGYLERTAGGGRPRARSSSTASSRTRSRSTSTPSATARRCGSARSCSTSRRPGVHSGDSACVIPAMSLGPEMLEPGRGRDDADRPAARRGRPDQHPVRRLRRRRAVRDRGQPARLAHGAVRLQGDRRAAGQGGLPADARRAAAPTWTLPLPGAAGATCR